jgi:nitrile hydratase
MAPDPDEPLFHSPWEARALALVLASGAWGRWTLDESRHRRERIPGPDYLRMSYYEKWIAGLTGVLEDSGLVTAVELASGRPDPESPARQPPLTADRVAAALAAGGPVDRPCDRAPIFSVGDTVRARNMHPVGHTRLPRYARGRRGAVSAYHGTHVFPDTNAHGLGEQPQPLYQVRFEASELWGGAVALRSAVYIDLWEDYLDAA